MSKIQNSLLVHFMALLAGGSFALATPAPDAGRFQRPEARHEILLTERVMVPMRDGVRLATDLYFPEGAEMPHPTVLIRTPYNKKSHRRNGSAARFFAGQGYVVAVQDTRGRFESEGNYTVSGGDAEDGYDTVEWLAQQEWSNKKIGTYGCSYLGDVQIFQAPLQHPHLAAMIPQASGSSVGSAGGRYRYFGSRIGGAFELAAGVGWFLESGSKIFYRPPDSVPESVVASISNLFDPAPKAPTVSYPELWRHLPLIDIMEKAGAPPTDWKDVLSRDLTDPWWDQFHYLTDDDRINVPALFVNSWYDFGVAETIYEFGHFRRNAVTERAGQNQFLIISPTTHCGSEHVAEQTMVGAREMGDARLEYWTTYLRWFDYWLKGVQNGITEMPKVRYFLMGRNEWRTADDWPIPGTGFTKYYLQSEGRANSRAGDGRLSLQQSSKEASDTFVYDPADPVPSVGGPVCCTGSPDAPAGAFDQSDVETREDVLVYSTPPLEKGVEVTGPLEAVLYVSSSARDSDFTAKLVDVYPDGRAFNIQEGILRVRYREGYDKQVWMKADEIYEVRIDLQVTGNYFGAGHRIRLEVSSSSFPRFDRNLNTGGKNFDETKWVKATNTVHHSERHPSHIVLPVVP